MLGEYTDRYQDKSKYLYVCGYLDNTVRVFNLSKKKGKHLVHIETKHKARVVCLKFSVDYKYLFTCDVDGVINHY